MPENFEQSTKKEADLLEESIRAERDLEEFLGREKAKDVAAEIYVIASEADDFVKEILADEEIAANYTHDGKILSKKGGGQFFVCFDGKNIMGLVERSTLKRLFGGEYDEFVALSDFLKHIRKTRDQAGAVLKLVREGELSRGGPMVPKDWKIFLEEYEKQMQEPDSEREE